MPKLHVSGPKVKGKKGAFDVSAEADAALRSPDVDVSADAGVRSPKGKKAVFGKISFPDVEFDLKSHRSRGDAALPKAELEGKGPSVAVDVGAVDWSAEGPSVGLKAEGDPKGFSVAAPELKGPKVEVSVPGGTACVGDVGLGAAGGTAPRVGGPELSGGGSVPSLQSAGAQLRLSGAELRGPSVAVSAPDLNMRGELCGPTAGADVGLPHFGLSAAGVNGADVEGKASARGTKGSGESPAELRVSFPKLRVPKFHFSEPEAKCREAAVDVDFPGAEAAVQAESDGDDAKGKKSKLKMPKFAFSKGKGKGGTAPGSPELPGSPGGSRGDLKSSKGSLGSAEGEADEGPSSRGMFSIFRSRKARHRSSSFSAEAPEPEADAAQGKAKFGTFGGVGSRSKGCYEVTGEGEEQPSSPRSSSSSSALRLPSLELTVAKRREPERGCT
ncbi:hypothetical protein ASZ78_016645 [Callipepla squamata]|uniref:Uncharacterized protein n=1 Tax=Callipepla squamata TaxID=9009 RepID=A0A226MBQ3_CALSU|nr:hypothetical protein ASZ78_016645 [Callipepla squamata]